MQAETGDPPVIVQSTFVGRVTNWIMFNPSLVLLHYKMISSRKRWFCYLKDIQCQRMHDYSTLPFVDYFARQSQISNVGEMGPL